MTVIGTPTLPHLLRISDLDAQQFAALLELSERMKHQPHARVSALARRCVACYFAKPSTRTRVSFEAAIARLGGVPIMLRPDELPLGRGEPITGDWEA